MARMVLAIDFSDELTLKQVIEAANKIRVMKEVRGAWWTWE